MYCPAGVSPSGDHHEGGELKDRFTKQPQRIVGIGVLVGVVVSKVVDRRQSLRRQCAEAAHRGERGVDALERVIDLARSRW